MFRGGACGTYSKKQRRIGFRATQLEDLGDAESANDCAMLGAGAGRACPCLSSGVYTKRTLAWADDEIDDVVAPLTESGNGRAKDGRGQRRLFLWPWRAGARELVERKVRRV